MFQVISVEEAISKVTANIDKYFEGLESEQIKSENALGRVLAQDIKAPSDLPPFSRSTVDGYVVKAKDTFGVSESLPAVLFNKGKIEMGEEPHKTLNQDETMEISTGGMLPSGGDAVVMLEDVETFDDNSIIVNKSVARGENVIEKGEDTQEGVTVLRKGHRLRSQDIGALAALGILEISVYHQPVIGIISTGDELIPPEKPLSGGKIRDINSWALSAAVTKLGGKPIQYGIIQDEPQYFRESFDKAVTQCDMVILSGGSSVGTRDLTAKTIDLGEPGIIFHGVSVKPGKPTIFGIVDNVPVFGLSGNPVSAMVTFDLFVKPAIYGISGVANFGRDWFENITKARLARNISSKGGREDFVRVSLKGEPGEFPEAFPVLGESGLIFTLVEADGLVRIPQNTEGYSQGEIIEVIKC
ncbi:gephyrin-like molybdotransferase Glp [Natranaerobius thermophilus]|uniref:Molybdopterin molybdenumtransferase n=1 Tax=Natranaerobius thermophilus (strain ATCC BAA-1301 / DSM 18059 / JW/NM-WN-LF) TaxID=457570 RepID=B2A5U9_NATTJ|nr:gephyrin-like molybdotransferase Glp [Natranaerobius thermophilus]ACB84042.1 molybdenum cofactor synthesis domain protein [Natranaerobius thermophilus JW/NM-WN-LF]